MTNAHMRALAGRAAALVGNGTGKHVATPARVAFWRESLLGPDEKVAAVTAMLSGSGRDLAIATVRGLANEALSLFERGDAVDFRGLRVRAGRASSTQSSDKHVLVRCRDGRRLLAEVLDVLSWRPAVPHHADLPANFRLHGGRAFAFKVRLLKTKVETQLRGTPFKWLRVHLTTVHIARRNAPPPCGEFAGGPDNRDLGMLWVGQEDVVLESITLFPTMVSNRYTAGELVPAHSAQGWHCMSRPVG